MNLEDKSAGELFRHLDKDSQKEVLFNLISEVVRVDFNCRKVLDYACNFISAAQQANLKKYIITLLREKEETHPLPPSLENRGGFLSNVFEENKVLSERLQGLKQRNAALLRRIREVQK